MILSLRALLLLLWFFFYPLITFVTADQLPGQWKAKAWQSAKPYPDATDYPERNDQGLISRTKNTAIAFTGGGSRSYLLTLGYLAGLTELGVIPQIRYITGISGGTWGTLTYIYQQNDVDEQTFLGPIVEPAAITREGLQQMDPDCARKATAVNFVGVMAEDPGEGMANQWCYATQKVYYEPVGIKSGLPFSWNEATVNEIKSRNSALKSTEFVIPKHTNRPFPIVGTAIVGPTAGAGYPVGNRNFTMIEVTPLYIGQMRKQEVGYNYHSNNRTHYRMVGGAVEPFAFGRYGDAPLRGLSDGETEGVVNVPEPEEVFDIHHAGCASSYAPGAFVGSFRPEEIASGLGLHFDYWSPAESHPSSEDTIFCDGGSMENILLPSLIQRRVQKIVLFFNTGTPLQPASKWNVYEDVPSGEQVSDTLSALFGIFVEDEPMWKERGFEMRYDQYFSKDDYPRVITALQDAQAKGNGIIATLNLTTIQNDWWGIPAGITTEITFVYDGRLANWEAQLSDEMKELLVPEGEDADDLSINIDHGPFRGFPHYITAGGLINYERANVLSDLAGWTIQQNAELFKSIFSS